MILWTLHDEEGKIVAWSDRGMCLYKLRGELKYGKDGRIANMIWMDTSKDYFEEKYLSKNDL